MPERKKGASDRQEPGLEAASGRDEYSGVAEAQAQEHRELQDRQEQKRRDRRQQQEQKGKSKGKKEAVQAGPRDEPVPPLPEQHLEKPGLESDLEPRPRYDAPDYKGSGKLEGMAAIITGADSGIGRSVAVLYAREGADVAVVYLSEHTDAEETRRAVEKEGRRCILVPGDVADPEFCAHAVKETVDAFGRLDILVNNAAFQEHAKSLEDISFEQLDRTFKTNIYGYFNMAKAALPHLKEECSIVNTTSVTALRGSGQLLDYSATKGAIVAFTRSLAQNLVSRGIRVNAVAPGPVWTPLNPADVEAEKVAEFGASVPMKRPAQPEELAPTYVFLASPVDSSYITGEVIAVLGGEIAAA